MNGVKVLLSAALVSLVAFGCCGKDATKCADGKDCKDAKNAQKLTTPDGDVLYVITMWDAECEPACPSAKACKTAKCMKTKDGKTYCVKPLKTATHCHAATGCKADSNECYKTKDGKKMEVDNSATASHAKNWCAKEVANCTANGNKAICSKEHVAMPNGKKGCAKADTKNAATLAANQTPTMDDSVVEDDYFLVVAD